MNQRMFSLATNLVFLAIFPAFSVCQGNQFSFSPLEEVQRLWGKGWYFQMVRVLYMEFRSNILLDSSGWVSLLESALQGYLGLASIFKVKTGLEVLSSVSLCSPVFASNNLNFLASPSKLFNTFLKVSPKTLNLFMGR